MKILLAIFHFLRIIFLCWCSSNPGPKVLIEPQSHAAFPGESITLTCVFDTYVTCVWLHNKFPLNDEMVSYLNFSKINTKDCSLEISSVTLNLTGRWQCTSKGAKQMPGGLSREASITIRTSNETYHDEVPVNNASPSSNDQDVENAVLTADLGLYIDLICPANKIDGCFWKRRNQRVKVRTNRSRYLHDEGNCNIHIQSVNIKDFGEWRCVQLAGDKSNATVLRSIMLTDGKESQAKSPETSSNIFWIIGLISVTIVTICFGITLTYKLRIHSKKFQRKLIIPGQNDDYIVL